MIDVGRFARARSRTNYSRPGCNNSQAVTVRNFKLSATAHLETDTKFGIAILTDSPHPDCCLN
jgi:hypothetical protein